MTALVNTVIESMTTRNLASDRQDALWKLRDWIKLEGMFSIAEEYHVLVNGSAEDFAISFMSTFNQEEAHGTIGPMYAIKRGASPFLLHTLVQCISLS